MMDVLVTGDSGFVGKNICRNLLGKGYNVIGLHSKVNDEKKQTSQQLLADIGRIEEVRNLINELPENIAIVHAAAALSKGIYDNEVVRVNCMGIQNILWLAEQKKSRCFIYLSGLPVIGKPKITPIVEDHPVNPLTTYHTSKLFGEYLVDLVSKNDLKGYNLRITAPVGPGMPKDRFLPTIIRQAMLGKPIQISGYGSRKQNYVDVRDIANAVELCLSGVTGGTFNIAGNKFISNMDLARRCVAACDSTSEIKVNGFDDPEEGYVWDVSIEKASQCLGYFPEYSIDDMINACINDMKKGWS